MTKMNFTEYNQLEAYYTNRLLNITKSLNKKVTVWQDVYDNGVVVNFFCERQGRGAAELFPLNRKDVWSPRRVLVPDPGFSR